MPLSKTGSKARFRHKTVKPKGRFDPRSFRTKKVGTSRVIIGCPKGKYSPSKGICKVGTQAQAILRTIKKNQQIPTAKIRGGITVLAHPDGYAKHYVNYTQAAKSVKKLIGLGINAEVYQSRTAMQCFYARILRKNPQRNIKGQKGSSMKSTKKPTMLEIAREIGKMPFFKVHFTQKQILRMLKGDKISQKIIDEAIKNIKYWKKHKKEWGFNVRRKTSNPRKKWYYGPSVQHRGKILVFPSAKSPTKTTHGRYIKNAVGPYASKISAMNAAKKGLC